MLKKKSAVVLTSLTALLLILGCAQAPGQISANEVIISEIDSITLPDLDHLKYGSQFNEFLINNWKVDPAQNVSLVCSKGVDVNQNSSWLYCDFNIERAEEQAAIGLVIKPVSEYEEQIGTSVYGVAIYETHYVYDIFDVVVTRI